MNLESESNISKQNRRKAQKDEKNRESSHPFKIVEHKSNKKFLQKRKHDLEQKALRKK